MCYLKKTIGHAALILLICHVWYLHLQMPLFPLNSSIQMVGSREFLRQKEAYCLKDRLDDGWHNAFLLGNCKEGAGPRDSEGWKRREPVLYAVRDEPSRGFM